MYIGQDSASIVNDGWARFTNVQIPNGATIDVAYLSFIAHGTAQDGSGTKTNLYFCDEDDPAAPTNQTQHAADPRTTAFAAWDDYDFPDVTNWYDSPSVATVIKEIVDRAGWNSGQAMMLLWDDDGSDVDRYYRPKEYSQGSTVAPKLHIEWSS